MGYGFQGNVEHEWKSFQYQSYGQERLTLVDQFGRSFFVAANGDNYTLDEEVGLG